MAQFGGGMTDQPSGERRKRVAGILFAICVTLLVLVVAPACAGLADNGTQMETLETMEARENAPPPTTGSPLSVASPGTDDQQNLIATGQQLYANLGCQGCHSNNGNAGVGPTWQGLYGNEIPLEGGETVTGDEAYITESILNPSAKVHEGFQPVMPSYQGQVGEPEIAALIEYIKSLSN